MREPLSKKDQDQKETTKERPRKKLMEDFRWTERTLKKWTKKVISLIDDKSTIGKACKQADNEKFL